MGKQLDQLNSSLEEFISKQKVFFVGTAMSEGKINISPKGMNTFSVVQPNRVVWLNLTGSGNETATHLIESNRMTILFCAFEGNPLILRLYGSAKVYHERDEQYGEYIKLFPGYLGSRQIIEMDIDLIQLSCGYGVPLMDFQAERTELADWAAKKGVDGIKAYQKEKNTISLDGHKSKLFE